MSTSPKNTKKVSVYAEKVFSSNNAMKQECKTLGFAFKLIIETKGVDSDIKNMAKKVKSNKGVYDTFAETVRKNPSGQFVPFYCLQLLYSMLPKADAKK